MPQMAFGASFFKKASIALSALFTALQMEKSIFYMVSTAM
jgi:hypothetical protein